MADNAQKTPFVKSLGQLISGTARDMLQVLGKSYPCSVVSVDGTGTIATIKFEIQTEFTIPNVTCPVYGPEYLRWPLKAGDKGVAFSSDMFLGEMSGLGTGRATFDRQANLSTLVFFPIGNKKLSPTDDPNKVVIYGPDGVILRSDSDPQVTIDLDKTNGVMVTGNLGNNVFGANIPQAASDAEAKGKGVLINGFYHNVNDVKIRLV